MHGRRNHEGTDLVAKAERYLAAVAVFRAEGSEPLLAARAKRAGRATPRSNSVRRDLLDPAPR